MATRKAVTKKMTADFIRLANDVAAFKDVAANTRAQIYDVIQTDKKLSKSQLSYLNDLLTRWFNHEHQEVLRRLEIDANGGDRLKFKDLSFVIQAANYKQADALKLLADHRANLDITDVNKCRAAHIAALNNDTESLAVLSAYNADLKSADAFGKTPLQHATENKNHDAAAFIRQTLSDRANNIGKPGFTLS